ncbi:cytochrome P450 family protein [Allosalinactinospora lopnorensis]|uniref:cytochrome P450 n=1 Tax=Allosalinactinospora lopnorensis TaxID=1352348 RepID=UPI000623B9DD|nr:cytochrome P450 [Allosalinactinospora lopnorensis]
MTDHPPDTPRQCPLESEAVPLYEYVQQNDRENLWESLRSRFGQVAPVRLEPDLVAWLVLGYQENLEVLRDWNTYSRDTRRWNEIRDGRRELNEGLRPTMGYRASALYADGAEHARLIAPINDALSRLTDKRLRDDATEVADRLIDGFCAQGRTDLMGEYAALLPAMLMNRLFGLSDTYGYVLGELSSALWSNDGATGAEAVVQMRNYFGGLVQRKRKAPGGDLPSWMMRHPEGLTDKEMADQLVLLAGAAYQPTANLLGNVLRELLVDRDVARDYTAGGLLLEEVVNHVIWTEPPMQVLAARFPTRDVTLAGTRIAEGEPLVIGFAAAHADPRLGERRGSGESPLPSGHNNAHLMWGAGEHRCPAQSVAARIVHIGVERLLARLTGIRLAVAPEELRWRPEVFPRGLEELPVVFAPEPVPVREEPEDEVEDTAAVTGEPEAESQPDDLLRRLLRWWRQVGGGRGRQTP